jgi:hypothetical protein
MRPSNNTVNPSALVSPTMRPPNNDMQQTALRAAVDADAE